MVTMDAGLSGGAFVTDAAISGGLAFLVGELEKRDEKLHEPLTSVTWAQDIPIRSGGGFVDNVSTFDVSYATSGGSNEGIMGGATNDLPIMQADIGKTLVRTFTWGHVLKVPYIDQQKLSQIGRSLDDILSNGIQLAYDKTLDQSTYRGFPQHGSYGLVNSPMIMSYMAAAGAGGSTRWANKTPDEILVDVNRLISLTWSQSEYDLSGMANHILLPIPQYEALVSRKVGVTGDKSILTFLLENNIGRDQGVTLAIKPRRWCTGAGVGGTDRMVGYANNIDRVRFDMTVPINRILTQVSAEQLAYLTPYVAQWSEINWIYTQHAAYVDGI